MVTKSWFSVADSCWGTTLLRFVLSRKAKQIRKQNETASCVCWKAAHSTEEKEAETWHLFHDHKQNICCFLSLAVVVASGPRRQQSAADVFSGQMSVAPACSDCSWKRSVSPDGGNLHQLDCFGIRLVGAMGQAKDYGSGKPHAHVAKIFLQQSWLKNKARILQVPDVISRLRGTVKSWGLMTTLV